MNKVIIGTKGITIPKCLSILFPYKEKSLRVVPKNKILYLLSQNKLSIILINWIFQGMLGMDVLDLIGKLCIDIFFTLIFVFLFGSSYTINWFFAFIIAHSINWLINTHFWVIGRFIGFTRTDSKRFYLYLKSITKRFSKNKSLLGIIVIGAASRGGGVKETSDIDMYFISKKGLKNSINSVQFTWRERFLAFINKFPLDLCLARDLKVMLKHRKDEVPFVIFDPEKRVEEFYKKQNRNIEFLENYPKG